MKDLEEYRNSSYHPAKSGLGRSPDYLMWSPSTWEMALGGIIQLKGDTKASVVMAAGSKDLDSLEKQCSPQPRLKEMETNGIEYHLLKRWVKDIP